MDQLPCTRPWIFGAATMCHSVIWFINYMQHPTQRVSLTFIHRSYIHIYRPIPSCSNNNNKKNTANFQFFVQSLFSDWKVTSRYTYIYFTLYGPLVVANDCPPSDPICWRTNTKWKSFLILIRIHRTQKKAA